MNLLQMSFYGAVMILVILFIRLIALNKLPKRLFILLWSLALLRLLVPFSISSDFSIFTLLQQAPVLHEKDLSDIQEERQQNPSDYEDTVRFSPLPADYAYERQDITHFDSQTGTVEQQTVLTVKPSTSPWISLGTGLWFLGCLLCTVFFTVSYTRCSMEFKMSLPVKNAFIDRWLAEHPLKRTISVCQSDRIHTPLTYGILHPVILLPKKTNWENEEQLRYILTHEFVHISRFDMIRKLVMVAALCLHWFNPFVWAMFYFFNRDIELFCDEQVVKRFGLDSKTTYAHMLLAMEEKKLNLLPLYNHFSKNMVKERITAIMKSKKATVWTIGISILLLIGVTIGFATSAAQNKNNPGDGSSGNTVTETVSPTPADITAPLVSPKPTDIATSLVTPTPTDIATPIVSPKPTGIATPIVSPKPTGYVHHHTVTTPTPTPPPGIQWLSLGTTGFLSNEINVPYEVLTAAVQYTEEAFAASRVYGYINWRIRDLHLAVSYLDDNERMLEIYQINYHLKSENPEDVLLLAGMEAIGGGWIVDRTYGNYLVFENTNDTLSFLTSYSTNDYTPEDPSFQYYLNSHLNALNAPPDESRVHTEAFLRYIDEKQAVVDFAEWVTYPSERANELGITDDDAPGGFFIYNEEITTEIYPLAKDCILEILKHGYAGQMRVTLEEFKEAMEHIYLFHVIIEDEEIVHIYEQYVP